MFEENIQTCCTDGQESALHKTTVKLQMVLSCYVAGARAVFQYTQLTAKHCENKVQDRDLEDSQQGYKPSDPQAPAHVVYTVSHILNKTRRVSLPKTTLGAL